jgi:hypothetical protein
MAFLAKNSLDPVTTKNPCRSKDGPEAQRNSSHPQSATDERRALRLVGNIDSGVNHANSEKQSREAVQSIETLLFQSSHVAQDDCCSKEREIL